MFHETVFVKLANLHMAGRLYLTLMTMDSALINVYRSWALMFQIILGCLLIQFVHSSVFSRITALSSVIQWMELFGSRQILSIAMLASKFHYWEPSKVRTVFIL